MEKIKTIMIPFDFTKASRNALEYAVKFVGRLDHIKIVLAYVSGNCNLKLSPENFEKLGKKYAGLLQEKLEWEIQDGRFVQTLLEIRKKDKIDLIIMGTSGEDKLGDTEHTNTANLVLSCNCPVLVVPKTYNEYKLENIALVIGKEEIEDTKKLGALLMLARKCNAKVNVLTVENEPVLYGYSEEEDKNESAIAYYLETFYKERAFIRNEDILDGINTYAVKNEIDLVTILPRNHTKNAIPSDAELTQKLILKSKVPLLILE
ncbi:universal stress protein [Maribacter sp. Asnod2-G09]|uniref:universal stress protein n=1 Tax=Maribacter sp. Asnod2-G09 TaxID=3160577 RepID=UPI0038682045